jgi:hypothetical protein
MLEGALIGMALYVAYVVARSLVRWYIGPH